MTASGLTVRYLDFDGQFYYYVGTTWGGVPEYTTDVKAARLMNERSATLAAQSVAEQGHAPEIQQTTLDA